MTHTELLAILMDKIPKMNEFDIEILKDIIAGIALKDSSLYDFYREITLKSDFVSIALIEEVAKKYTVPQMYRDHIDQRFNTFKNNIKIVSDKNNNMISLGEQEGINPDKWFADGKKMFSSTEKLTIEKAGGLSKIRTSLTNVGYFEYLRKLFEGSATDVSKVKYALMMKKNKQIEGK